MMFLGISEQVWELFGWIAGFGVGFFLFNLLGDLTWRRLPPESGPSIRPAE